MMQHSLTEAEELLDEWPHLRKPERVGRFRGLPREQMDNFFLALGSKSQSELVFALPEGERRLYIRLLAPDDAADLIQESPQHEREYLLDLLDEATRQDARALLAYREDVAGGLMNPRFARLRPEAFIDEAITYLRQQLSHVETIYYAYVLDEGQHLLGVVSLKGLVASESNKTVEEVMTTKLHKWRDWISTDRDLASGGKILRGTLPTGCSHHRAKFAWRGHFWDCDRLNVAVYFAALRVS